MCPSQDDILMVGVEGPSIHDHFKLNLKWAFPGHMVCKSLKPTPSSQKISYFSALKCEAEPVRFPCVHLCVQINFLISPFAFNTLAFYGHRWPNSSLYTDQSHVSFFSRVLLKPKTLNYKNWQTLLG